MEKRMMRWLGRLACALFVLLIGGTALVGLQAGQRAVPAFCAVLIVFTLAFFRPKRHREKAPAPEILATVSGAPIADLNVPLLIRYRSGNGHVSDRLITLHAVDGEAVDGQFRARTLAGYCHTRKAPRTFRCDRIIHIADPDTGEIIPHFATWMLSKGVHL
jgi:hypothetical protein